MGPEEPCCGWDSQSEQEQCSEISRQDQEGRREHCPSGQQSEPAEGLAPTEHHGGQETLPGSTGHCQQEAPFFGVTAGQ